MPLVDVGLQEFTVPAPAVEAHHPSVQLDIPREGVHGWLIGVTDGKIWGWWGPVEQPVAVKARDLLAAAFPTLPAEVDPETFARRLRRATRHAHTGFLALTVGALELALWDLAGKRAGRPVWALLGEQAVNVSVAAYATCFGLPPTPSRVAEVMAEVADAYAVQKWPPFILEGDLIEVTRAFAASRGPRRLAVDFFGKWHPDRVREACAPLGQALAWVEEPYHPDEVDNATDGEFGVPHAAGEHCYGPADAAQLLAGHVDVWQPDAVFCGGLVNLVHLVRAAAQAGAQCTPHGGGLLPAVHLAAVGEQIAAIELHLLLGPRRCAHLAEPLPTNVDELLVPTSPGWCGDLRKELSYG